ncbi:MAG: Crp/Fnr family transcriptional regulator [Rhizobium sp.]|nr:Crp/Fnr family transcriptional regulator [Rhizobium sp.]
MIARLMQLGTTRRYAAGSILIKEGARADCAYVLLSGRARVLTTDADERKLIYNKITPGEIFGEMALDGGTRSASVVAETEVECLRIQSTDLQSFALGNPDFAYCIMLVLIGRLRTATVQLKRLGLQDVSERVISVLMTEVENVDGKLLLPSSLTQQEISDRIGATREMVNQVIRKLTRSGHLTRLPGRRLQILKPLPGANLVPR